MKTKNIYLTFDGKIKGSINAIFNKEFDVCYTIDNKKGIITTTSILIYSDKKDFLMFTFNYQDLKNLLESKGE